MAIKKYKAGDAIMPGQFVCMEGAARHFVCTYPAEVISVSGARVYIKHERKNFVALSRVRYVCDSEAEGQALSDVGIEMVEAVEIAARKAEDEAAAPFLAKVKTMLSN